MGQSQCLQSFEMDGLKWCSWRRVEFAKLVYSKKMERKTKRNPWKSGLHMIQDPLEEGGVVKPSVCLHILLSGMG